MNHSKIAIIHPLLSSKTKGGGEIVDFKIRDYFDADFWTISYDEKGWSKTLAKKDEFVKTLWKKDFIYLKKESEIPIWRKIKRLLACKFIKKEFINKLEKYDTIIFSDDIPFLPRKLKNPKKILYRHTNPHFLSPQKYLQTIPSFLRPFYKIIAKIESIRYIKDLKEMDKVISNSEYTKQVLKTKTSIDSEVIFPPIKTRDFKFISQKDYYLSFGRLDDEKRIKLIVKSFIKMPNKKLIIAHTGPLKNWVTEQSKKYENIEYIGSVGREKLAELVGNCIAGIYIPHNEGAGITQCEIMAAGKPVVGVKEGGLLETVIDKETGILIKKNPNEKDLIDAIKKMTPEKALEMKKDCIKQAKNFDEKRFFENLENIITRLSQPTINR